MKMIREDIYTWSVFSEEKQLDFNGLYLRTPRYTLLIDPPPMEEADRRQVESLGKPSRIYLSNKHHTRASAEHRELWGAALYVHEAERPLMEIPVDATFNDGELIDGELEVIRILDAKTPGECAFFWKKHGVLIVGDALIGKAPGALSLLSDEKFKNPEAFRRGLAVLRGFEFQKLLVGDGASIFSNAKQALEQLLHRLQDR
ncbi:MAG TPA: hypothetical protein DF383_02625 [Deltaproteobacteria bacterium]|nr:hypothetical protein [Deltaproteobacteria bacterium]